MKRVHERTAANRVRSKPSLIYRGIALDWHPDSWEFSFLAPSGQRIYCGAQFSARRAIDEILAG